MSTPRRITIRSAGAGDAPVLARMRYEFRTSIDPADEDRRVFEERCEAWMAQRLADPATGWRAWVALHPADGPEWRPVPRIVGHVWARLLEKIPNPVPEAEVHAYLTNMYVEPAARGSGIGSALLRSALTWCRERGVGSAVLWPTSRSRTLYERAGFRDTGDVWELAFRPAHPGTQR